MTIDLKFKHRLTLVLHSIGLSCLGGAVFLQILVFSNIAQQGYFMAIEKNTFILSLEIALTIFTLVYFAYYYLKMMRSNLK